MSIYISDHKPRHADGFCREVTLKDVIFPLHIGEITTTFNDVSCLMHLPIKGKLLDHERISERKGSI